MSQTACAMESVREEAQPEQKMWARHQVVGAPRVPSSPPSQNLLWADRRTRSPRSL
jgi:hypothetical protein